MITKTLFDTYKGRQVNLFTLENENIKVGVLDYGGILNFIKLKTHKGEKNVLLSFGSVKAYEGKGYCGAAVGRVANRIARSRFELGGKTFTVSANEGENSLHGGVEGFDKKFYKSEISGDTLTLSLVSEDGDMGYPGRLEFSVEFTLNGRELIIKYRAVSDKDTLFAPTNHAYFNLNGGGEVMDNLLKINADGYTPTDEALIPLGTVQSVKGTPYDFTSLKRIGDDYAELGGKTYDVNFALNGGNAVVAQSITGGVTLEMSTSMPGVQLYVGRLNGEKEGEGGCGFCIEPQFFPNAVNVPDFKSPVLKAGERAEHTVRYLFGFHAN